MIMRHVMARSCKHALISVTMSCAIMCMLGFDFISAREATPQRHHQPNWFTLVH